MYRSQSLTVFFFTIFLKKNKITILIPLCIISIRIPLYYIRLCFTAFGLLLFVLLTRKDKMESTGSHLTWEFVDKAATHESETRHVFLKRLTLTRRMIGLVKAYSFIKNFLSGLDTTNPMKPTWCTDSTFHILDGIGQAIVHLRNRIKKYGKLLQQMHTDKTRKNYFTVDHALIESRLTELADPDKKIWSTLHSMHLAPEIVLDEFQKVQHLLLGEPISNFEYRKGKICPNIHKQIVSAKKKTASMPGAEHINKSQINVDRTGVNAMSSDQFYQKYMRSDTHVGKSNRLSNEFCEVVNILPGIAIKTPRKDDRFLHIMIKHAAENNVEFPCNQLKAHVFTYVLGGLFGISYCAVKLFNCGFTLSSFYSCGALVRETSWSKLKTLLKAKEVLLPQDNESQAEPRACTTSAEEPVIDKDHYFPRYPCFINRVVSKEGQERKIIKAAVSFTPTPNQKLAVALFRKPVAEQDENGYLGVWLSRQISIILGRDVSANYALLIVANFLAESIRRKRSKCKDIEDSLDESNPAYYPDVKLLKGIYNACGLYFKASLNIVVPIVGFGSGMTNTKLKLYMAHCLKNVVERLIKGGRFYKVSPQETEYEEKKYGMNLVELSRFFFNGNEARKPNAKTMCSTKGENHQYEGGECMYCDHVSPRYREIREKYLSKSGGYSTVEEIKGLTFEPCEERRKVCEQEYHRVLNTPFRFSFNFGGCNFKYPLPASSDRQSQIKLQLGKHQQRFYQREISSSNNWYRLLQFFYPLPKEFVPLITRESDHSGAGNHPQNLLDLWSILSRVSRYYVQLASVHIRKSVMCEQVMLDIGVKFNANVLPLGREPSVFLRSKYGLMIIQHAREIMGHFFDYTHFDERDTDGNLERERGKWVGFSDFNSSTDDIYKMDAEKISRDSPITDVAQVAFMLAKKCLAVEGKDRYKYNYEQTFLPTIRESDKRNIFHPYFDVDRPVFPKEGFYVDRDMTNVHTHGNSTSNTGDACQKTNEKSAGIHLPCFSGRIPNTIENSDRFWLEENSMTMLDSLSMKDIVSTPAVMSSDLLPVLVSGDSKCGSVFSQLSMVNHEELKGDKPRVYSRGFMSNKDRGLYGRNSTEFSSNSVIVLSYDNEHTDPCKYNNPEDDGEPKVNFYDGTSMSIKNMTGICVHGVESQTPLAQNEMFYPRRTNHPTSGRVLIEAPDISPLYRFGGKDVRIIVKHCKNNNLPNRCSEYE